MLDACDRYFSSKGHDAPGLYAILIGLGRLPFDKLFALRTLGGLPGHPDVLTTPEVVTNTGSLGMGISKARGFVLADRLGGRRGDVYVLTGDGELQEGQFWESLQPTANRRLGEITVIVDHNKLQSDTWVSQVSDLGELERKVEAFGWAVARCDGHDLDTFSTTLTELRGRAPDRPKLLVADTLKGAGVGFMEPHDLPQEETALYDFHSGAPGPEAYAQALAELIERLNARLAGIDAGELRLATRESPRRTAPERPQRLIQAYGEALVAAAEHEPSLVALDGDLRLDTGLVPFQERFPERFFECGIAEQDMVSQAGAMALAGLLPVVPLVRVLPDPARGRADLQQRERGDEGALPRLARRPRPRRAWPLAPVGARHRADGLGPGAGGDRAVLRERGAPRGRSGRRARPTGPVYLRLVSPPWPLGFDPPAAELVEGRGTILREGEEGTFVCTGPVLVSQAWAACERARRLGPRRAPVAARDRRRLARRARPGRRSSASTTTSSPAARARRC